MASLGPVEAVVFDVGGVLTASPLPAIARYAAELGVPARELAMTLAGSTAFALLECGLIDVDEACARLDREVQLRLGTEAAAGFAAADMFAVLRNALRPRPEVLQLVAEIAGAGLAIGILTNNWKGAEPPRELRDLVPRAVVVESRLEAMRKPGPAIFARMLDRLGVAPGAVVFLDDIGANVKTARLLGMHTIKVPASEEVYGEAFDELALVLRERNGLNIALGQVRSKL
ncbi:epoxide hydrolase [Thecamonas trahens ATCC 50062]|uniref:Epoxide hydrolase n=1 Tax=Thecamonas trahens ATCC 50062 TaxID=461836 RepID=A0A0L0D1Z4_THETB|nr:epoxide hydrolase [Thecamonas trahens ATCC 50062]KNC46374.1 epoxide hydrolase [Thecamonas trahens ATCC 50062]|eukprot:XP_013760667.1 epoxide hydrolase [Thecamonas trahens ATCC 50062]